MLANRFLTKSSNSMSCPEITTGPKRAQRQLWRTPSWLSRPAWLFLLAATSLMVVPLDSASAKRLKDRRHHFVAGRASHHALGGRASRHARAASGRHAHRFVQQRQDPAVHTGIVPLANTTWDRPVMSPVVIAAILDSAREMRVDPDLLSTICWRESRFDPAARNHQSSATGLLQFTSGTWLQAVHDYGAKHGAAAYAAIIHRQPSGDFTVDGRHGREEILKLRNDPVLSAGLAAETMARQVAVSRDWIGREPTSTDLYLLHVLGRSGSARFLAAVNERPAASTLAVANPKLLRNAGLLAQDGRPMTVASTYAAVGLMLEALRMHSGVQVQAKQSEPPAVEAEPVAVSQTVEAGQGI